MLNLFWASLEQGCPVIVKTTLGSEQQEILGSIPIRCKKLFSVFQNFQTWLGPALPPIQQEQVALSLETKRSKREPHHWRPYNIDVVESLELYRHFHIHLLSLYSDYFILVCFIIYLSISVAIIPFHLLLGLRRVVFLSRFATNFFFFVEQQPPVGRGLLFIEAWRYAQMHHTR